MKYIFYILISLLPVAAIAQDELIVLSPHWEGLRREFASGFQDQWKSETGRDVTIRYLDIGGTSDIVKFIRSEFSDKPEGIGIDLFFGGGVDPYIELGRAELLEKLDSALIGSIPQKIGGSPLVDPAHRWLSVTMNGFGILTNSAVLKRIGLSQPMEWNDLAKSEAYGWVSLADPRKSGSAHLAFELILQAYGWERGWSVLLSIASNSRGFLAASSQIPKDVAVGEAAYGLLIDSYADGIIRRVGTDRLNFVIPKNLSVYSGDAVGILKGAPNRDVAKAFVKYTISESAQRLLLLPPKAPGGPKEFTLARISVLPNLFEETKADRLTKYDPFSERFNFEYDSDKGARRWAVLNDLFGAFLIEPHAESARWRKVAIDTGSIVAPQFPISETQIDEIVNNQLWEDQEYRNRTISQWGIAAREVFKIGDDATRFPFKKCIPVLIFAALLLYGYTRARRVTR